MKTLQKGFTIIELLIATTIFSLVLLMATAGIMHVTKQYYQGVVQARVQEAVRTVIDEIGESVRFSSSTLSSPNFVSGTFAGGDLNHFGTFCLGAKRFAFAIDRQLVSNSPQESLKQKRHVLWTDQPAAGCPDPTLIDQAFLNNDEPSSGVGGREVLSENMRLTKFSVAPVPSAATGTYRVEIGVAYGDEDLLDATTRKCKTGYAGSEFCAYAEMSVTITKRLD